MSQQVTDVASKEVEKLVYIVLMQRWGDDDSHHYIIGAFDNEEVAIKEGKEEQDYRGGKYDAKIVQWPLNKGRYRNMPTDENTRTDKSCGYLKKEREFELALAKAKKLEKEGFKLTDKVKEKDYQRD